MSVTDEQVDAVLVAVRHEISRCMFVVGCLHASDEERVLAMRRAQALRAVLDDDDEVSSSCRSKGPDGAECGIRHGHVGQHGGIDDNEEWRQW